MHVFLFLLFGSRLIFLDMNWKMLPAVIGYEFGIWNDGSIIAHTTNTRYIYLHMSE